MKYQLFEKLAFPPRWFELCGTDNYITRCYSNKRHGEPYYWQHNVPNNGIDSGYCKNKRMAKRHLFRSIKIYNKSLYHELSRFTKTY